MEHTVGLRSKFESADGGDITIDFNGADIRIAIEGRGKFCLDWKDYDQVVEAAETFRRLENVTDGVTAAEYALAAKKEKLLSRHSDIPQT